VKAWDDGAWVRDAALAHARKQRVQAEGGRMNTPALSKTGPCGKCSSAARQGLDHKHCGSLHASDAQMACRWRARSTRGARKAPACGWCEQRHHASDPGDKAMFFDPMEDKVYRHPTFYELPDEVNHM
jgi:ring-1,2-phenylacetyl-CoA epoxidase subunit PaaB